jgi:hypothetical protein
MVHSMLLNNPQVRALDRFFETAMGRDLSPFAVMDRVLDNVSQNVPPKDGCRKKGINRINGGHVRTAVIYKR